MITVTASTKGLLTLILHPKSASKENTRANPQLKILVESLQAYLNGKKVDFPVKLDLSTATPFQKSVWEAARSIPYSETRSYRWVAEKIGKPGAARAVGQALGKNPLPIIVPCHRVIASDGSLGGYSGGLDMKRNLLKLERSSSAIQPQGAFIYAAVV